MLHLVKKDDKSQPRSRQDPMRQSQQYHNRKNSLMLSAGYLTNSSRSPSQTTLKTNNKATIPKGSTYKQAANYQRAVKERAKRSERAFLNRMASAHSQDHSRNNLLSYRSSKGNKRGEASSQNSGHSKKAKAASPTAKKRTIARQQKNDKKDGIVPYQSQISLKNKKVPKRSGQNKDIYDHYIASKVQAQARVGSRVKELQAREECKSAKKTRKKRKEKSAPVREEPEEKPSAAAEEQQQQISNESIQRSPPETTPRVRERMFEGNTDLSSVMPEATGERRVEDTAEQVEQYVPQPYYTPTAKVTEILLPESAHPISNFKVEQSQLDSVRQESTPTTTEPDPENMPYDEFSPKDQECYTYVNVEAYALARCAQKALKQMGQVRKHQRKELIKKLVERVDYAIEKLSRYQRQEDGCSSVFATQAAYICQSILMFEKYKLEESLTDVNQRIRQLLHILKHLAFQEAEDNGTPNVDKAHWERQAHMFTRVYRNHLLVLMYLNADQLEIAKIEKVFQIIEFLVTGNTRGNEESVLTSINVKQDLEQVLGRNRDALTKND